jgi:hypothetical protein
MMVSLFFPFLSTWNVHRTATIMQFCLCLLFLFTEGDDEIGDWLMIHSAKTKLEYNPKKNNKLNTKGI